MTREEIVEGNRLLRELRKEIKRPAARKQRVHRSAKAYVGSQEIMEDMCEWRIDYWIQRSGIDWILHLKGEEGRAERIGPLEAPALAEEVEDRGLDAAEFNRQLLANRLPMLTRLAQEIETA